MATATSLSLVGVLAQGAMRLAYGVLIGRVSGPGNLGLVTTAISTAMLGSLLWPSAAGSAASKYVARARAMGDGSEAGVAALLLRRTAVAAPVVALLAMAFWGMQIAKAPGLLLSVGALVFAYCGYSFVKGLQFGSGKIRQSTGMELATDALALACLVAVVSSSAAPVLILPLVAAYGTYCIAGLPRRSRGHVPRSVRREVDQFVALVSLGTVSSAGFLQITMLLASSVGSRSETGYFAAALTLATPLTLFPRALSLVLFPAMSAASGRADDLGFRRQTDLGTRALAMFLFPAFGFLVLNARWILETIYGSSYGASVNPFLWLLFATLLGSLSVAAVNSLTAASHRGVVISALSSLSGLVVGGLCWVVVVPLFSITGISVGYLVGSAVIATVPYIVVWRHNKYDWLGLSLRIASALVALAAAAVAQTSEATPWWAGLVVWAVMTCVWLLVGRGDVKALGRSIGRPVGRPAT